MQSGQEATSKINPSLEECLTTRQKDTIFITKTAQILRSGTGRSFPTFTGCLYEKSDRIQKAGRDDCDSTFKEKIRRVNFCQHNIKNLNFKIGAFKCAKRLDGFHVTYCFDFYARWPGFFEGKLCEEIYFRIVELLKGKITFLSLTVITFHSDYLKVLEHYTLFVIRKILQEQKS